MVNKKKKARSHKSQLKQQKLLADSQLVNDSTILALTTMSLSCTVHATVLPNSNSNYSSPITLALDSLCPNPKIHSSSYGPVSQYHVDPSPSINHIFIEYCSDDDDFDDEEVDFDSSEEDYEAGSKFFTTPVFIAPPSPFVSPTSTQPTPVLSCSCADSALAAVPAPFAPKAPMDATTSTSPEPPSSTWRNLFAPNHDTTRCLKLIHYSAFTETRGCNLVDDDLDTKCDY